MLIRIALHAPHKLHRSTASAATTRTASSSSIDTVREEGKPATHPHMGDASGRAEPFRPACSATRFGPVDVTVSGDSAVIRYAMKDGHFKFDQRIQLQDDGRSVSNHVMRGSSA